MLTRNPQQRKPKTRILQFKRNVLNKKFKRKVLIKRFKRES